MSWLFALLLCAGGAAVLLGGAAIVLTIRQRRLDPPDPDAPRPEGRTP